MKKTLLMLSVAMLSLNAAEDSLLNNSFSVTGDFAYFKREQSSNRKLVIDRGARNCSCHYRSCTSKDLQHDFSFEPGFKVAMTYTTPHTVWDLSYLWLETWEKGCSKTSPGAIIFSVKNPGITTDFNGADYGQADYSSEFQNSELNFFRYMYPRHGDFFSSAYLVGVRYMTLRESLDVAFTKASNRSSYKVHVSNFIPAVQLGALVAWNPTPRLTWDLIAMAGVGFDRGQQKTFLGDLNNSATIRDYEEKGFSTPLVIEALVRLVYQPASFINIHIAYQFIYLNGVLLAPDQLVKSSSDRHVYRAIGAPLIHGMTAGLSWSF
jgi:hypothetical protein